MANPNRSSRSDGWVAGKRTRPTRRRRGAPPLEKMASASQRTYRRKGTTNQENREKQRHPCNLQMKQLALSIMKTPTRTHTNKGGHRDTNEQAAKTSINLKKLRWKCVKLHDKERREDRLQSGLKQCGERRPLRFAKAPQHRCAPPLVQRRQLLILHLWEGHKITSGPWPRLLQKGWLVLLSSSSSWKSNSV